MSRLGKKPIPAPNGVTIAVKGQDVSVKGPKGTLNFRAHDDVEVAFGNGELTVKPRHETTRARALWGTTRAVLANNVKGVTEGFEKNLEMTGVGYRAAMQGKNLQMQLGYSHDIVYPIPTGITIAVPKPTEVVVTGFDKQQVGQVAAELRGFKPPEPYKGKGVKYSGEYVFRKEGKKK
jgi:large subunit ribosomal protein L6